MLGVAALVTAGVLLTGLLRPGPAPTPAPTTRTASASPDPATAARVDTVVVQTLIAAARLDAFAEAAPGRRAVVLDRTQQNLAAATAAVTRVVDPNLGTQPETTRRNLVALSRAVTGLQSCLAQPRHARAPSAAHGAEHPGCVVSTEEVQTARAVGASVAALLPHGTQSAAQVARISASVRQQAIAEARAGSTGTVTVPAALLPGH